MRNIIYTTKTRKENNMDFWVHKKWILEVLHDNSMLVVLNWCERTLRIAMKGKIKKWTIVGRIMHEQEDWTEKLESFYTHFLEQVVNKPIEDKEIYLGQLLMIVKKIQTQTQLKKSLISK